MGRTLLSVAFDLNAFVVLLSPEGNPSGGQPHDLARISNTVGCPISRVLCEKWDARLPALLTDVHTERQAW